MSGAVWFDSDTMKILKGMARNIERIADALERAYPDDLKLCSCSFEQDGYGQLYNSTDEHCPLHGKRAEMLREEQERASKIEIHCIVSDGEQEAQA